MGRIPHHANTHSTTQAMLVYGALMSGQSKLAVEHATRMGADLERYANITNSFWPAPIVLVWARFGKWDDIRALQYTDQEIQAWQPYFQVWLGGTYWTLELVL